jgi:hypothetical protein
MVAMIRRQGSSERLVNGIQLHNQAVRNGIIGLRFALQGLQQQDHQTLVIMRPRIRRKVRADFLVEFCQHLIV